MVKLSPTQLDTLQWAAMKAKRSHLYGPMEGGWFYPQFTTRGGIEHFCRPQTCKALVNKGLLIWRSNGNASWDARNRRYREFMEYHISQEGIEYIKGLA